MVSSAVAALRRRGLVRPLAQQLEELGARCGSITILVVGCMGVAWRACMGVCMGSLTALPLLHARSSLASCSLSSKEATACLPAPAPIPAAAAASSHGGSWLPPWLPRWEQQWGSRGLSTEPASQGGSLKAQQGSPALQPEARTPEAKVDALIWLAACANGQASMLRGETSFRSVGGHQGPATCLTSLPPRNLN